ncbi:hypothetical protein CLOBOL_03081 [Enterocloster bolteae ATCC BAA-613]|uniref:Uncharacterized protein n=1 Tax=Enterocloster bolteae (strain ATCC BAA-613 / DSM 15670 / CCUG 46953 / JCM 12243 / WAL 16351) TaxID=411902 RepID=A8RRS7_ENTBW|nr:hypothetical protein CLOBOL_03081 [Enterocloster bolteae ATCC BAA-613]
MISDCRAAGKQHPGTTMSSGRLSRMEDPGTMSPVSGAGTWSGYKGG